MWKAILTGVYAAFFSVVMAFGATAQQAEIEGTINSQLEAFKIDNFEEAFTYATPRLQQLFQTPQNFQRMVVTGYPMVWRPAEVQYLDLYERDGDMFQTVQIVDQDGARHLLLYRMQQTDAGWRIGGVQILQLPDATA